VEKQKIKSQWNAARRKEGLPTSRRPAAASADEVEDDEAGPGMTQSSDDHDGTSGDVREMTALDESGASYTSRPSTQRHHSIGPHRNQSDKDTTSDLRELRRKAYSSSAFHTHKADPLGRRQGSTFASRGQGAAATRGDGKRGGGTSAPAFGSSRGGRNQRGGRGQPDMRLRMNVMLEKIKRDFT
jgi:hypothetical protein